MNLQLRQAGITLIEVVIAMSVITAILTVVGLSIQTYVEARSHLLVNTQQIYLIEEGFEVVRALRDDDWDTIGSLTLDTPHYLAIATTTIAISGTPEMVDGIFSREIIARSVYRNGSDDIVASTTPGATVDTNLREIEVRVGGPTGTSSMQMILANLFEPS